MLSRALKTDSSTSMGMYAMQYTRDFTCWVTGFPIHRVTSLWCLFLGKSHLVQSGTICHYREVQWWVIFMEQKLRFGLDSMTNNKVKIINEAKYYSNHHYRLNINFVFSVKDPKKRFHQNYNGVMEVLSIIGPKPVSPSPWTTERLAQVLNFFL